jgi:deoxycytidine triphosphate deaminase
LRRKDPQTDLGEASLFLVAQDIRRRIKEGSLGIEPFDESQLGDFAIDLRVGQQFRGLPLDDLATPSRRAAQASATDGMWTAASSR